jgi:hypothetical protein
LMRMRLADPDPGSQSDADPSRSGPESTTLLKSLWLGGYCFTVISWGNLWSAICRQKAFNLQTMYQIVACPHCPIRGLNTKVLSRYNYQNIKKIFFVYCCTFYDAFFVLDYSSYPQYW